MQSEIEYSASEINNANDSNIKVAEIYDVHFYLQPKIKNLIRFIREISKILKDGPLKILYYKNTYWKRQKELMIRLDCFILCIIWRSW